MMGRLCKRESTKSGLKSEKVVTSKNSQGKERGQTGKERGGVEGGTGEKQEDMTTLTRRKGLNARMERRSGRGGPAGVGKNPGSKKRSQMASGRGGSRWDSDEVTRPWKPKREGRITIIPSFIAVGNTHQTKKKKRRGNNGDPGTAQNEGVWGERGSKEEEREEKGPFMHSKVLGTWRAAFTPTIRHGNVTWM